MKAAAVIVAGGKGKRFGTKIPKQFLPLCGKPVFMHSVKAFSSVKNFKQIVLVVPADMNISLSAKYKKSGFSIVSGGKERFDSVKNGLKAVRKDIDFIAVHDAARPLINKKDILSVLNKAIASGAAIAAEKTRDTVKTVKDGFVKQTLDRSVLWNAQTPQIFASDLLLKAYSDKIPEKTTDDSQIMENMKIKVAVVETKFPNFKITSKTDFEAAKNIILQRKARCI